MRQSTAMLCVILFFAIVFWLSGCQIWQRDRSIDSRCHLKCTECNGIDLKCDLATEKVSRVTKGKKPIEEEDKYKE